MATTTSRGKTGEKCSVKGTWQFDTYLDGKTVPTPTVAERQIPLDVHETFPPIRSASKACWWELVRRS